VANDGVWTDITSTNAGDGQVCGVASALNTIFIAQPVTYGSVQATVRIADSLEPLAGMWVQLIDQGNSGSTEGYCWGSNEQVVADTQTDSNGLIDFGQVPVGNYCVRLNASNVPEHDPPSETSRAVSVTEGQLSDVIFEYTFIPTGSIQAQFVDSSGAQFAPADTLCVTLKSTSFYNYDICDYDGDGYEERSDVRAGHYEVAYLWDSPGYTPLTGFPMSFDVVADQTGQIAFPFGPSQPPASKIVIDVVDSEGLPVADTCITLHATRD